MLARGLDDKDLTKHHCGESVCVEMCRYAWGGWRDEVLGGGGGGGGGGMRISQQENCCDSVCGGCVGTCGEDMCHQECISIPRPHRGGVEYFALLAFYAGV